MDMKDTPAPGLESRPFSMINLCPLPPDVAPLPAADDVAMRRWLDARRMHGCERDAALKGFEIGRDIGELVLYVTRKLPRRWRTPAISRADVTDRRLASKGLSRVHRAALPSRARALQAQEGLQPLLGGKPGTDC